MGFELYELFNFRSKNYSEKSKICVWIRQTKKIEHCKNVHDLNMYSQVLRRFIARGSGIGFSQASPTKVEACKSFLFTDKSPCIENKDYMVDFDHKGWICCTLR